MLVTGGTGFIGTRLVEALIGTGARVFVLRRLKGKSTAISKDKKDNFEYRYGDFSAPSTLEGVCDGVDTVFHLAGHAHVEDSSADFEKSPHWRVTVEGPQCLLKQARAAGVKRLIFVSTVKAMGEGGEDRLDETSPATPEDFYGMAKREAERLILSAGSQYEMHVSVLRLPMVYGLHNTGNLARMIVAIRRNRFPPLSQVYNRRSMVHVEDVVQALFLVSDRAAARGQVYLITDDEVYSASRIYDSICAALSRPPPVWRIPAWLLRIIGRGGDILSAMSLPAPVTSIMLRKLLGSAWYSCEKAKRELGYRPSRKLEDVLPEIVNYLK